MNGKVRKQMTKFADGKQTQSSCETVQKTKWTRNGENMQYTCHCVHVSLTETVAGKGEEGILPLRISKWKLIQLVA